MIESITIDYEGPDGNWLRIQDPEGAVLSDGEGPSTIENTWTEFSFQLTDEACQQLVTALQPWLIHQEEGKQVLAEYVSHRMKGRCTHWVDGVGPCLRTYGHEGEHDAERWPEPKDDFELGLRE